MIDTTIFRRSRLLRDCDVFRVHNTYGDPILLVRKKQNADYAYRFKEFVERKGKSFGITKEFKEITPIEYEEMQKQLLHTSYEYNYFPGYFDAESERLTKKFMYWINLSD